MRPSSNNGTLTSLAHLYRRMVMTHGLRRWEERTHVRVTQASDAILEFFHVINFRVLIAILRLSLHKQVQNLRETHDMSRVG